MTQAKSVLIGLTALALSPILAAADDAASTDISGAWGFSASMFNQCTFIGTANLSTRTETQTYACTLTATHICPGVHHYIVEQSCDVSLLGAQVSVRSSIDNFIKRETVIEDDIYFPDNFSLTLKSDGSMFGSLNGRFAARWTRSEDGIS